MRYTFSQPITSVRVSNSSINGNDIGTMSSNSISPLQFYDLCGLLSNGNVLSGSFGSASNYGNVGVSISSATPFTTITLTNTGGQSGWVTGNPCNFIINPTIISPFIVNCPKVSLETKYYHATFPQNTSLSIFTAGSGGGCPQATINGVPCTDNNVTIEPVTPLATGCTFNANGTILIAAGTLPFGAETFYRLKSVANPNIFSQTYKVYYGVYSRVFPSYNNSFSFLVNTAGTGTTNSYANGSFSVFAGSTINTNTTGGLSPAFASTSNVTITNLPGSGSPYFTINPAGNLVYTGTPVPLPVSPNTSTQYIVNYSMCLTGSNVFCATSSFIFNYVYLLNRPANTTTNLDTLLVSPNPSADGLYQLTFDQIVKEAILEVHTLTGEKVYTQKWQNSNKDILLLDKMSKGIYILKVITDDQTVSKKISKE